MKAIEWLRTVGITLTPAIWEKALTEKKGYRHADESAATALTTLANENNNAGPFVNITPSTFRRFRREIGLVKYRRKKPDTGLWAWLKRRFGKGI